MKCLGGGNFEGHIHWRRRHNQPNDKTKMIGLVAEHILCYAKNSKAYKLSGVGKLQLTGEFSNPDNDVRGDWASKPWKVGSEQSGTRYEITTPTGKIFNEEWMGDEDTFNGLLKDNRIIFTKKGDGLPRKKYFKFEREEEGQCATNWWEHELFGHNQLGSTELANLFNGEKIFSNPKNTLLLKSILSVSNCKNEDVVMDFFAGSGSLAHSVMLFNKENKFDNLKFICVQLPENLDEAFKTATTETKKTLKNAIKFLDSIGKEHTIFEITKERIIRSAQKIQDENPDYEGDLGFKIFETVADFRAMDDSEFSPQIELPSSFTNPLSDKDYHTLLTTWRIYDGSVLTDICQDIDLGGYTAHWSKDCLYLIQPNFSSKHIKALLDKLDNDKEFVIGRIILFSSNIDSAKQKELKQALDTYNNKKNLNLSLLVRY